MQQCKSLPKAQRQAVCDHPEVKAMAEAISARLSECDCRGVANLAWAQAVMDVGPPDFMQQVDIIVT